MVKQDLIIMHESGLHARPASMFVRIAHQFKSRIMVEKEGKQADAKSLLQVLGLGAGNGSRITVTAEGEDEAEAMAAIARLVKSNFVEEGDGNA